MSSTLIFINSNDSITNDSSRATFLLNSQVNINNQFTNISVNSFIFPNTRPTIHSLNNKIYFYESTAPATLKTATLTIGFYDITQLISHIQTTMNALGGFTYTITYNSITKKITIGTGNVLNTFAMVSGLSAVGFDDDCLHELGILPMSSFVVSKTSDCIIDIAGSKFIDIRMNIPCQNQTSSQAQPPIVRVGINQPLGSVIFYDNPSEDPIRVSSYDLNQLDISIVDDNGKPYLTDLYHSWSLTLKLTPS
jgi:hypothetical protein